MITRYDYLNIAFYFAFIVGIGIYFARRNKDTSDYFRGGGVLPWWVTGVSAWMAAFTAWTFTGAAGKMYSTGPYVLGLYYANIIPIVLIYFFTCRRFRRLRVVTPLEGIRLRFGQTTQQFYTWIRLPIMPIFGALGLNAVAVFMAAVFRLDVTTVIIGLGVVVTLVSMLGGALGVAAGDFVQMFLVVTVTVVISLFTLARPEVGGVSGLIEQFPARMDHSQLARPEFFVLWVFALMLTNGISQNSLADDKAAKYMMARNDTHARRMVLIPLIGAIVGPLLWMVPPMAAAIVHPNLAAEFPHLAVPNEAAFLVMAADVLPQGMMGLLVCAIFAATLTTMDASLNQGAGVFVRNFYLAIINPNCPERKLLWLSKATTGAFGVLIVLLALLIDHLRKVSGGGAGLFDLVNQVGVSLLLPLAVPACLGMFYRRTPPWSAWTTVLLGLFLSIAVSVPTAVREWLGRLFGTELKPLLSPENFAWVPGFGGPFVAEERTVFTLIATVLVVLGACTAWFFFTTIFYARSSVAYRASVDEFFARTAEPLPDVAIEENEAFPHMVGRLCLLYGGFLVLLMLIPNTLTGRLCYLGCGGVMLLVGGVLVRRYRVKQPANSGAEKF